MRAASPATGRRPSGCTRSVSSAAWLAPGTGVPRPAREWRQDAWLVEHAPHAAALKELARRLSADVQRGLSEDEAGVRLERYGPNRLKRAARPRYAAIAIRQFADPLVGLLVVAAAVSALIGEGVEAAAIAAILVLNALLGFVQEAGAERAVLALRDVLERHASVIRSGRERELLADELVPGDLIVLREGERVPADARVVEAAGLAADESALT